jgi:hypothetical protein
MMGILIIILEMGMENIKMINLNFKENGKMVFLSKDI